MATAVLSFSIIVAFVATVANCQGEKAFVEDYVSIASFLQLRVKLFPLTFPWCMHDIDPFPPLSKSLNNVFLISTGLGHCGLPPDSGPCLGYFPMFFYNSTSMECESFVYGGCGGNANRFNSYQECKRSCGWLQLNIWHAGIFILFYSACMHACSIHTMQNHENSLQSET